MHSNCIFCGANAALVYVHGHYQCSLCKTNALPCCDGDTCDNFLLATKTDTRDKEAGLPDSKVIHTGIKSSAGQVKTLCTLFINAIGQGVLLLHL